MDKDGSCDSDPMDKIRNVFYVMVIAAAILWLSPLMLGDGPSAGDGETAPPEPSGALATKIVAGLDDAEATLAAAIHVLKYGLTVAALASIAVLRVRGRSTTRP